MALHARQYAGVSYPQVTYSGSRGRSADGELKLYEWFVANDQGSGSRRNLPPHDAAREALERLEKDVKPLPVLKFTPPAEE